MPASDQHPPDAASAPAIPPSSAPSSAPLPAPSQASTAGSPASRGRIALGALIVLIVLVPIVVALTLGAPPSPGTQTAGVAGRALHFTPVTSLVAARAPRILRVPAGSGTLVALVHHATELRSAPGGRVLADLASRTGFGSVQQLWVVHVSGRWLGVVSPLVGNNRLGWIPAADASLTRVDWELKVSLAARRLLVLHGSRTVRTYEIAIGKPSAPTPTGRFAVTDRLTTGDPGGPYGCCILALSAKAPHSIQDWSGGDRIAIHSTPETSSIGQAVSHGCMRLTPAEGRWLLEHIPLGTPTLISS